jgi:hypothetical protein
VAKLGKPPLQVPDTMRNQLVSLLPGRPTYVPHSQAGAEVKPLLVVHPEGIKATGESIARHEGRIKDTFLYSLWLAITGDTRDQRATAEEIRAAMQERMLQLGQFLTRFDDEALDPMWERSIPLIARRGLLPPAPRKSLGKKIRPEYISILAQAQKAVGTTAIERFVGFVAQMATETQDPSPLDKIDKDKIVEKYGDALGVDPDLMKSDEDVAQARQQRQKQLQGQQAIENAPKMAAAAKSASGASLDGNNALTRILSGMSPAAAATIQPGPNEPAPSPF